jgi:hypothetical protein
MPWIKARAGNADSRFVAADGRRELATLALAIAEQVEERRGRFADSCDFAAADDVSATESGGRYRRRAAATALGVVVLAVVVLVGAAGWMLSAGHHGRPTTHRSAVTPAVAAPASPAGNLGRAAARRLGAGGRPVTVFGCRAAYDADAAAWPAVLPTGATSGPAYTVYMHACMSGMS